MDSNNQGKQAQQTSENQQFPNYAYQQPFLSMLPTQQFQNNSFIPPNNPDLQIQTYPPHLHQYNPQMMPAFNQLPVQDWRTGLNMVDRQHIVSQL